mgnify:FL=1
MAAYYQTPLPVEDLTADGEWLVLKTQRDVLNQIEAMYRPLRGRRVQVKHETHAVRYDGSARAWLHTDLVARRGDGRDVYRIEKEMYCAVCGHGCRVEMLRILSSKPPMEVLGLGAGRRPPFSDRRFPTLH